MKSSEPISSMCLSIFFSSIFGTPENIFSISVFLYATFIPFNLIYYHSSDGGSYWIFIDDSKMHFFKALFSWALSFVICYSSNADIGGFVLGCWKKVEFWYQEF